MRKSISLLANVAGISVLVAGLTLSAVAVAGPAAKVMTGKEIAFDRTKGNCLACHMIQGGELAGNIAPPLIAMKARFPDKAKLRAQIYDATATNPNSIMPPFGKYRVISEKELDLVTDYIHSL